MQEVAESSQPFPEAKMEASLNIDMEFSENQNFVALKVVASSDSPSLQNVFCKV